MTMRWAGVLNLIRSGVVVVLLAALCGGCASSRGSGQDGIVSLVYTAVREDRRDDQEYNEGRGTRSTQRSRGLFSLFGGGRKSRAEHPQLEAEPDTSKQPDQKAYVPKTRTVRYPTTQYQYCLAAGDEIAVSFFRKPPSKPEDGQYRIRPLDRLRVVVEGQRLISELINVRADGKISFHMVGDLDVDGKTIEEARQALKAAYTEIVPSADVSIMLERGNVVADEFLREVNSNESSFTVVSVRPDGVISLPLIGDLNINGMSIARVRQIVEAELDRRLGGVVGVNLNLMTVRGNTAVLGEVRQPGMYPLYEPQHPMYALAMAGGKLDTANLKKVVLLKKDRLGYLAPKYVNLTAMHVAKAQGQSDVLIGPEDILVVPKSGISKLNLWVDQFIRKLLPVRSSASATYNINE